MKKKYSISSNITSFKTLLILFILGLSLLFRLFLINKVPPSLYWEEVALGYDAYSILHTGKDHHGHWFPIVALESFGDYKPALYAYAIIPFIALFGLGTLSVRLPSVVSGVVLTYLIGLITKELTDADESLSKSRKIDTLFSPQILAMVLVAFSPWGIQFSRGGWEVNLATTLITTGIYFGIRAMKALQTKKLPSSVLSYYLSCAMCFVAASYTYHATRVIGPGLGLVLAIPLLKQWRTYSKQIIVLGCVGLVLMAPLGLSIFQPEVNHRLRETSTFNSLIEVQSSNAFIESFHSNIFAKLFFHRYFFYLRTVIQNIFSHLRLDYLFLSGDKNPRHSIQYFGLFYPFDIVLMIFGGYTLIRHWKRKYHLLWIWWLIGIFPASLTTGLPHALRTLPTFPVWVIVMAMGGSYFFSHSRNKYQQWVFAGTASLMLLAQSFVYFHHYLLIYPQQYSQEWQYGYEELVTQVNSLKKSDENIFITREQGRPAMYYWFYSKTSPQNVQKEESSAPKDQGEFLQFQNVWFMNELKGEEKGLIASSPEQEKHFANVEELKQIKDLSGKVVWVIYRSQ